MKPIRIVLFGITVFSILGILTVLFQNKGKVMGLEIKVPSLFSFLNPPQTQYKDISNIIKLGIQLSDSSEHEKPDTLIHHKDTCSYFSKVRKLLNTDSLQYSFRNIEFPPDQDTLLYPFFYELLNLHNSQKLIRILHYGDSQIEGDRITSYIRNQFQMKFGGGGIGMLPVIASNPAAVPYFYNVSGNWKRFSPIPGYPQAAHHKYGALLNFSNLTPDEKKLYSGWIEFIKPGAVYPLAQHSQNCKIFYGNNKTPIIVEIQKEEKVIDAEILPASSSTVKLFQLDLSTPRNTIIKIKSESNPDIYGLSLDAQKGIAVDNIPLRGSSGSEFSKIDSSFLRQFYSLINVRFIIFQFGANTVPYVTGNYDFYEKSMYKQLHILKQASRNMPILVVGVGDVSRNGENGFESYPNIEQIRNAQRQAAFEAGCAFWDLYEAMGGHNSMPSWVFAKPSLAQKDFVHLNPLGAKIIGEMLCRSIMGELDKYLQVKELENQTK